MSTFATPTPTPTPSPAPTGFTPNELVVYSQQPVWGIPYKEERQKRIEWLLSHGMPPLPVAPAQDPFKYPLRDKNGDIKYPKDGNTPIPKYCGKNPSYLDRNNIPHHVPHKPYQKRLPSPEELAKWFENPANGIGTLGGWNNTVWIDLDRKLFDLTEECDKAKNDIVARIKDLTGGAEPFLERTQSGGWRIGVRLKTMQDFTNFTTEEGGAHRGEILGAGRFTVLAPTIGPYGNPYESITCPEELPEVESIDQLGIFTTRTGKTQKDLPNRTGNTTPIVGAIPLSSLISSGNADILAGRGKDKDRSKDIAALAQEVYGWMNFCNANSVGFSRSVEDLCCEAGNQLRIDPDRIDRILKTIDSANCEPAAQHAGGDKACWEKIMRVDKPTFENLCPPDVKEEIQAKRKAPRKQPNGTIPPKPPNGGGDGGDGGDGSGDNSSNPKVEFTQLALETLYRDKPWISVDKILYYWNGTYYKKSLDGVETKRLADFFNFYPVFTKEGRVTYPYANPRKVKEALEWVKIRLYVPPELVNPPGLNCTNGILKIEWNVLEKQAIPTWKLVDHTPDVYYIHKPQVKYDPEANSELCDRLLAVLDPPQRDIFLKTIAASIDLSTVRKYKGRLVRGLLLKGHGSNGKDALRGAVTMMYGEVGITGCSLSDFGDYDRGDKFSLYRLKNSRVNWSSENGNTSRLDKIQSLKAFITGDTLSAEQKGKDEVEFTPTGIALFNVNDTPKLQGSLEAITSRYGILSFTKTFKIGADPSKGELEADPKFKDDPNFLREEVLPAFLNCVLNALQRLMIDGIDYSPTQAALEAIQAENHHLFQFCKDTGLDYRPGCTLTAGQIWEKLEEWYQANGTLTYEETTSGKTKAVWADQAKRSDSNVKAVNQVIARFKNLFPKAVEVEVAHGTGKKMLKALKGIGFPTGGDESPDYPGGDGGTPVPTPNAPPPTPVPPQSPPQQTTEFQYLHPNHPNIPYSGEKIGFDQQPTDPGGGNTELDSPPLNHQNGNTPQQLGCLGCKDGKSSTSGVENWGGTGVENTNIGVEDTPDEVCNRSVTPPPSGVTEEKPPKHAIRVGSRLRLLKGSSPNDEKEVTITEVSETAYTFKGGIITKSEIAFGSWEVIEY